MYLLDTNVLSELRKQDNGRIDPAVETWARKTDSASLHLSAVTIMEIELGIGLLDRRDAAQAATIRFWFRERVLPAFAGRILPIDNAVALRCAQLHVPDPRSERDAWIAAAALVHGLTIVTRNTADFAATGVTLLNPWREGGPH